MAGRKRKQMQYSGWSSEAEVASLHKWTKGMHLVDTVRRIQERDLGAAELLAYAKQALSKLRCFSFSQTRRIPKVWDAVDISVGEIKTNLDKVEELADKISAATATATAANDTMLGNNGNDNWEFDLRRYWQRQRQRDRDAYEAFLALHEVLFQIHEAAFGSYHSTISREDLENKLGITWQATRGA